jgi:hypothetical protein
VFFWLGLWLWRHGYNNEITDFHHSVEQIRHCIFLRCLPCVIFMESSGKFSIGLSSLFTGNIDWQGCRLNNLFAMLQIAVFPQTLVEIVLHFLPYLDHFCHKCCICMCSG